MYEIIKKTLKTLHDNNIDATPKNYAKEFYTEAEALNLRLEDKIKINQIINSLCQEEKKALVNKNINTATELIDILKNRTKQSETLFLISYLTELMKPSIDQNILEDIESLVCELQKEPSEFVNKETIEKISNLTENRIKQDRRAFIEKSNDMQKLTALLSKHYDKSLIQSCNTSKEISTIKSELETLELSEHSVREITSLQKQLVDTIYTLEHTIEQNKINLIKGQDECNIFESKIKELQLELTEVKKEKNIDFLTGVLNRRGFDKEFEQIENSFKIFNTSYAIIFYDIDDFKKVNDTYGHDCGDVILKTFGTVLNQLIRKNDIIARYGGEEFVALINYKKEDEIKRYTKRVKEIIANNKFVYKDNIKIKLKFSAGVTFRTNYENSQETIKKADELLYKAKHQGKDQIIFDNGIII